MYAPFSIDSSNDLLILHIVLKSGAPGLLEDKLNHDGIALGPTNAEFEADAMEQRGETREEAGEASPSPPPVLPKDSYSPASWNHPLPESVNNLPLPHLEARKLLLATTPPQARTTSVLPHSTTVG